MPYGFAPTKSGAHRLICRALYKNLLSACSRFPTAEALTSESQLSAHLKSLVRYRFHHDRSLKSPYRIRDALAFGRETLDLINEAASGQPGALNKLTSILNATQKQIQQSANARHTSRDEEISPPGSQTTTATISISSPSIPLLEEQSSPPPPPSSPLRPSTPILSRPVPLSSLSVPRRSVPHYIVALGVPFLKYGPAKSQPPAVTRMIRGVSARREKRWLLLRKMEKLADEASWEDEWDREVEGRLASEGQGEGYGNGRGGRDGNGNGDGDADGGSWSHSFRNTERETMRKLQETERALFEKGKVLFEIYKKEREMARREKLEREREKRDRKRAGK